MFLVRAPCICKGVRPEALTPTHPTEGRDRPAYDKFIDKFMKTNFYNPRKIDTQENPCAYLLMRMVDNHAAEFNIL